MLANNLIKGKGHTRNDLQATSNTFNFGKRQQNTASSKNFLHLTKNSGSALVETSGLTSHGGGGRAEPSWGWNPFAAFFQEPTIEADADDPAAGGSSSAPQAEPRLDDRLEC